MPRGRSKRRLRSARTMRTRVRTSATCTCNRAVSIRPNDALRRALTIDADLPQANNTVGLAALERGDHGAGRDVFPRGAARPAGPCRGSEQSRHSVGGPPRLSGGGVPLREGDPQRSGLCGSSPRLWAGAGADAVVYASRRESSKRPCDWRQTARRRAWIWQTCSPRSDASTKPGANTRRRFSSILPIGGPRGPGGAAVVKAGRSGEFPG